MTVHAKADFLMTVHAKADAVHAYPVFQVASFNEIKLLILSKRCFQNEDDDRAKSY
jgi:hypothetical protein